MRGVNAFAAFGLGRGIEPEHDCSDFAPVSFVRRRIQQAGIRG